MEKAIKLIGTKDELERAYDKIHAWFFAYPMDEMSLSDLSRQLNISKSNANVIVNQLADEGFLFKKELGRLWRIKANTAHKYFTTRKIAYNLKLIYESGIVEYIKENIQGAKAIVLFGSYRYGTDLSDSDIDIAVEISGNDDLKMQKLMVGEIGYRKNIALNIHIFSRNKINLNLFSSIANGIILNGFLEVQL